MKITPGTFGWNNEADAFRHAFMRANISIKTNPSLSKFIGDGHE